MFKRNSILVLLIALAVLLGVYFLIDYTGSKDRTFKSKVMDFEPELVDRVAVNDPQTGDFVEIIIEEDKCILLSGDKEYSGSLEAATNVLAMINTLPTESVAATSSKKWEEYKVDEEQALHIQLYEGKKLIGELFVGKFDFKQIPAAQPGRQPQTRMTSYARVSGDDNVYAVNGLLRSNFQGGPTPFRNRTLFYTQDPGSDITGITISGASRQVKLEWNGDAWMVNGLPADSAKTDKYIRQLARLRSSTFMDEIDVSNMSPVATLLVEGTSFDPVTINAYPTSDTLVNFYMTSTINPGSVFNGEKGKIFDKAFVGIEAFLPE